MWNKPTGISEFVSFMSQIDEIILQHLPFRDTHFLFLSQWHRNLWGYYSQELCCTLAWAGKCLMTARSVPFHMTQRKTQKCMTRSQQRSHQLRLGYWGRSKNGTERCLLNWAKLLVDDAKIEIWGRRCNFQQSHSHCSTYYLFSHSLVVLFH